MEKKSIIKRMKEISHEVWAWFRFLFFQAASIGGAWVTCFHIPTIWADVAKVWSESNLLYVPDLLFALFIGAEGVITILGCIRYMPTSAKKTNLRYGIYSELLFMSNP